MDFLNEGGERDYSDKSMMFLFFTIYTICRDFGEFMKIRRLIGQKIIVREIDFRTGQVKFDIEYINKEKGGEK